MVAKAAIRHWFHGPGRAPGPEVPGPERFSSLAGGSGGQADLVAAVFFRAIQGLVGPFAQCLGTVALPVGNAAAERHPELLFAGLLLQLGEALADFVEHVLRIPGGGVGQNHRKLLTAVAADVVGFAQALFQEHGQAAQYAVADGVAVGVVDLLELVNIDHGKGQRLVFLSRPDNFLFQQVQGVGVVVQAGQAVANHQCQQRTGPATPVVDGRHQVFGVDRLGQEVVAAQAHGLQLLVHVFLGRQVDNRHAVEFVLLADDPGDLGAGSAAQLHVENDDFRRELVQAVDDLHRVGDHVGVHAGAFWHRFHKFRLGPKIVQYQHLVGLVGIAVAVGFDFLDKLARVYGRVKEFLAAAARCPQPGFNGAVVLADEDDRDGGLVPGL